MTGFELPDSIVMALLIVVVAIVLDTLLGLIKGIKGDNFDFKLLPKFLASGILPYVGALVLLAMAAQYIGAPYRELFYLAAAAVLAKYLIEIKEKILIIFEIKSFDYKSNYKDNEYNKQVQRE